MKHSLFTVFFLLGVIFVVRPCFAADQIYSEFIKGADSTVYYYNGESRFIFPSGDVFTAWPHSGGFDVVQPVSQETLASIPLKGNIVYPCGTLVKVATDPKVYVVDEEHELHWIQSENTAKTNFGDAWAKEVKDVSDAYFSDYEISDAFDSLATTTRRILVSPEDYSGMRSLTGSPKYIPEALPVGFPHPEVYKIGGGDVRVIMMMASSTGDEIAKWAKEVTEGKTLLYSEDHPDWTNYHDIHQVYGVSHGDSFSHIQILTQEMLIDSAWSLVYSRMDYPAGYLIPPIGMTREFVRGPNKIIQVKEDMYDLGPYEKWYKDHAAANGWVIEKNTLTTATVEPHGDQSHLPEMILRNPSRKQRLDVVSSIDEYCSTRTQMCSSGTSLLTTTFTQE
jgi:hypothetical protein